MAGLTPRQNFLLHVLIVLCVALLIVPFDPSMPSVGLDNSWVYGTNQAVADKKAFGIDYIFTFGPYASVITTEYHPATDSLMLIACYALLLSLSLILIRLVQNTSLRMWVGLYIGLWASIVVFRDSILFTYPLLLGVYLCNSKAREQKGFFSSKYLDCITVFVVCIPLGLLPLIKGTHLISSVGAIVICSAYLLSVNRSFTAIILFISAITSFAGFWWFSGQEFNTLPSYLVSQVEIVSGYSSAMSIPGRLGDIVVYILCAALILLGFLVSNIELKKKLFYITLTSYYLFLVFKSGFVRHDAHAIMAGTALIFASVIYGLIEEVKNKRILFCLAFLSWLYIDLGYRITTVYDHLSRPFAYLAAPFSGGLQRIFLNDREVFNNNFIAANEVISKKADLADFEGSVDIISYSQSHILALENKWLPRPVFQSYQANNTWLLTKNEKFLSSDLAPDNLLFQIQPIDNRYPGLQEGYSWPTIIEEYEPFQLKSEILYLRKRAKSQSIARQAFDQTKVYDLGERVSLPTHFTPLIAKIGIEKNLFGIVLSLLYKPESLQLEVTLESGAVKEYRIVPGMSESGFIISPLIESSNDFALLYFDKSYLKANRVTEISISTDFDMFSGWAKQYSMTLEALVFEPDSFEIKSKFNSSVKLDQMKRREESLCLGAIERLGVDPQFNGTKVIDRPELHLAGWVDATAQLSRGDGRIFLSFKGERGDENFYEVKDVARPDVAGFYFREQLLNSGFESTIDLQHMRGQYDVGVTIETVDGYVSCSNLARSIIVELAPWENYGELTLLGDANGPLSKRDSHCLGNLDHIEFSQKAMGIQEQSDLGLLASGWIVNWGEEEFTPEGIYLSLEDEQKNTFVTPVASRARPDIAVHFDDERLIGAGFSASVDSKTLLPGRYNVGVVGLAENELVVCKNLRREIIVK
jgi:hypothetical protein